MAGFPRRRHPPWLLKGGRGVTFIELIILTVAMLILASIAVPRMGPVVQGFRLRGAGWQLGGDLRLARQRALTSQQRFRISMMATHTREDIDRLIEAVEIVWSGERFPEAVVPVPVRRAV